MQNNLLGQVELDDPEELRQHGKIRSSAILNIDYARLNFLDGLLVQFSRSKPGTLCSCVQRRMIIRLIETITEVYTKGKAPGEEVIAC